MTYIFLAGIDNSPEGHWQRHWHRRLGGQWVEHRDWGQPDCAEWVEDLDQVLKATSGERIIIAHSLGCLVAAEWARTRHAVGLKQAFMVAVPDPAGANWPADSVHAFSSPFSYPLNLQGMIVASQDDCFASFSYSMRLAFQWHSQLADVGAKGHINLASDLGEWKEGRDLLKAFEKGRS